MKQNEDKLRYAMTRTPAHTTLHLWVNGASAGKLTTRRGEEGILIEMRYTLMLKGAKPTDMADVSTDS